MINKEEKLSQLLIKNLIIVKNNSKQNWTQQNVFTPTYQRNKHMHDKYRR